MKRNTCFYIMLLLLIVIGKGVLAQTPATNPEQEAQKVYVVVKNDGARFYGRIISQDAREVLIETDELGQIFIPRHEIREIREVASRELDERGVYVPGEVFSTRYFITTNGLPVQK
ncbi:MAG: hypothetical protein GX808_06670, partial [Syntrophomonadaceae bacterium]|nr:hypothetical protein [Syntrophomonadaceae bacterium]